VGKVGFLGDASAMMISPILVLFVLTQRTFVKGVASEGLK